jgi:uncharacterized protein (UPF0332 family)
MTEADVLRQESVARARDELEGAEALLAAGHPRIALTRAYFAAFHAVRALLFRAGLQPQSHRGVHALFHAHFVRLGTYDSATAAVFARLQKYREEADYSVGFGEDATFVAAELASARALVDRLLADVGAD